MNRTKSLLIDGNKELWLNIAFGNWHLKWQKGYWFPRLRLNIHVNRKRYKVIVFRFFNYGKTPF